MIVFRGVEYKTVVCVCRKLDIPYKFYCSLVYNKQLNVNEALELTLEISRGLRGEIYTTITEMVATYNYTTSTYWYFRSMGYSHLEVLEIGGFTYKGKYKVRISNLYKYGYKDEDICKAFALGIDLFEYLALPKGRGVEDHLGNIFKTKKAMALHYGLNETLIEKRLRNGWSLEDALTKRPKVYHAIVEDHLGNKYPTFKAMCNAYGLPEHVVSRRLTHYKFSLEDALTKPKHKRGERFWDDAARQDGYGVRRLGNTGHWVLEKVD